MKKQIKTSWLITALLLITAMMLSLAACGAEPKPEEEPVSEEEVMEEQMSGTFLEYRDQPFQFETVDFYGDPYTSEDCSGAKVILVNFWEPWCGPCVGEIPELEKLYENYQDQGFLILGAYSETGMNEDITQILEEGGVTYPVIYANEEMQHYMTDYYPTSFFIDGSGTVLSEYPVVGSQDYDAWEALLKEYL